MLDEPGYRWQDHASAWRDVFRHLILTMSCITVVATAISVGELVAKPRQSAPAATHPSDLQTSHLADLPVVLAMTLQHLIHQ